MIYPDMTRGTYGYTVGWFGTKYSYQTGDVSEEFLSRLLKVIASSQTVTLSYVRCALCEQKEYLLKNKMHDSQSNEEKIAIYKEIAIRSSPSTTVDGKIVDLTGGDFNVYGKNEELFWAPKIVYHLCVAHGYRPPIPFIEAIMASGDNWAHPRTAPDPERR